LIQGHGLLVQFQREIFLKERFFWAKSGPPGLSLLAHALDTAAVAREILCREPGVLEILGRSLGLPPPDTLALVSALCGLHDLGKASPVFQARWEEGRRRLEAQGFSFPPERFLHGPHHGPHHGVFSQLFLEEFFCARGWAESISRGLALALASHHGLPPDPGGLNKIRQSPRRKGSGLWEKARRRLCETVFRVLEAEGVRPRNLFPEGAALLMGLTSVADWVASNEDFFPPGRSVKDPEEFLEVSSRLAREALERLGWSVRLPLEALPSFRQVFPFAPNPLQGTVAGMLQGLREPLFLLVEAPMGGGKTEAALYAHLALSLKAGERGLYLALPTQATGNAMFGRLRRFLEGFTLEAPVELQLQHGTAVLHPEYLELRAVGEEEGEGVRASEWFSPRKRAMLAPYGVGTVDQALLSVLRVRHHFVRLFGLARRTVVLDEVHAYDAYTSGLIETLVRWLRLLGSSLIVMTATLSPAQRRSLLKAAGAEESLTQEVSYPRITVVSRGKVESQSVPWPEEKRIEIRKAPLSPEEIAVLVRELSARGGVVGAVVNTVERAQALYLALGKGEVLRDKRGFILGKRLPEGLEVYLFHARFPSEEREARERAVLARFGKEGQRPERAVLVATQVVEQSLDLDFDVLVTDLAPVDLVFQRAGRLHRHPRPRPPDHERPRLFVSGLSDPPPDLSSPGWDRIYYPYLLLATWWHLRNRTELLLPRDLEPLVSLVYDGDLPADLPEDLAERFRKARDEMERDLEEKREFARRLSLHPPEVILDPLTDFLTSFQLEDEEESPYLNLPLTRLGEPSVLAVPVFTLEEGLFFDPEGQRPVPLKRRLSPEEALLVFRRSVRLSRRGLVQTLCQKNSPWEGSPLVRRARLLKLDPRGEARFGRLRVRLSPELGLIYEKEDEGESAV